MFFFGFEATSRLGQIRDPPKTNGWNLTNGGLVQMTFLFKGLMFKFYVTLYWCIIPKPEDFLLTKLCTIQDELSHLHSHFPELKRCRPKNVTATWLAGNETRFLSTEPWCVNLANHDGRMSLHSHLVSVFSGFFLVLGEPGELSCI